MSKPISFLPASLRRRMHRDAGGTVLTRTTCPYCGARDCTVKENGALLHDLPVCDGFRAIAAGTVTHRLLLVLKRGRL